MKCQICKINESEKNNIVCSDRCNIIRLTIIKLSNKYTPTNGCKNCWGDLRQGCSEKCKEEFKKLAQFISDLYFIVNI